MIKNSKIIFQSGKILNSTMLEELQKFSLRNFEIKYDLYSDGIIYGLDFEIEKDILYLLPGILKYKKKYFFLEKKMEITDLKKEKSGKKYLYLIPKEEFEENNITTTLLIPKCTSELKIEDSIYLGEFLYREGIKVRFKYDELDKMEEDIRINIIKREYAGKTGKTLSPIIIKLYAEKIANKNFENNLDGYIYFKGLNCETVEIDILKKYLEVKDLEIDFKDLYKKLLDKKLEDNIQNKSSDLEKKENKEVKFSY